MAPNLLTPPISLLWYWILDYLTISTPTHANARYFRFGIPLVVKITHRTTSTEAHALRFLHSTGLNLPIPRLICSFVLVGTTYTIMRRVKGEMLCFVESKMDNNTRRTILAEVDVVLRTLATITPAAAIRGKVMISPSGHDLPDPSQWDEARCGPFRSKTECWTHISQCITEEEFNEVASAETRSIMEADPIAYVHPDLRMYNVLVHEGHVSAIIDWEDSGWFPSSWQVHTMRWFARFGCYGWWYLYWRNEHRFSEEAEAAYEASKTFLIKSPV